MPAKTKQLTLVFNIPAGYKYMATQPWGETVIFKRKPKLSCDVEMDCEGNQTSVEYWSLQQEELSLIEESKIVELNKRKDWKNSVVKI